MRSMPRSQRLFSFVPRARGRCQFENFRAHSQGERQSKPAIDRSQQGGWNPSDTFGEESLVDGDYLRDVDNRRLRQARPPHRKPDIAGRVGQTEVRSDDRGNDRIDAAFVKAVGRDDEIRPAVTRPGPWGLRQRRPPDFAPAHCLPAAGKRAALKQGSLTIKRGFFTAGPVYFIESGCDQIFPMPLDERSERRGVKLASGNAHAYRQLLGRLEYPIRNGNSSLHRQSITLVIPGSNGARPSRACAGRSSGARP